ncbi:MAG: hypothetical protein U0031_01495 [Thermomicrobiales bacterium]
MISRAAFVKGLGAAVAAAGVRDAAAKKKKKRCPKPPICPESCSFIFYGPPPANERVCGIGNSLETPPACRLCKTSFECVGAFPHCVNSVQTIATGEIRYFTECGFYESGVCGRVSACIT